MKSLFDVVVCGSLHLDIVVSAPALPRIDETAVGSAWKRVCGGKGGNQAVQAARAGAQVAMLGRVGQDEFGRALVDNLEKQGVDVSGVAFDPTHESGMSVAILQDNGDYGAVIVSGANLAMDASGLANHWSGLAGGKVLVLQNEVPHAVNVAMATCAHASGATVVLNAAPARELGNDLLGHVDVLVVNRIEAEALCATPVGDRVTARGAIAGLAGPTRAVVITLGGDGLVVADTSGVVTDVEPIPVQVISTHGAGDCFIGILSTGLAKGLSVLDACRKANEGAAAFVSRPS
jgi:ribokinase